MEISFQIQPCFHLPESRSIVRASKRVIQPSKISLVHGGGYIASGWEIEWPNFNPDWKFMTYLGVLDGQDSSHCRPVA